VRLAPPRGKGANKSRAAPGCRTHRGWHRPWHRYLVLDYGGESRSCSRARGGKEAGPKVRGTLPAGAGSAQLQHSSRELRAL